MKVLSGRQVEARAYVAYILALFRPGTEVPLLIAPATGKGDLAATTEDDYKVIIEEGRRTLDRQAADIQRNHTRAATLLTVTVAEAAYLVSQRPTLTGALVTNALWAGSILAAVLALGGAISVLTTRADYGAIDTGHLADLDHDHLLRDLALQYTNAAQVGGATNATRLTILRDAVWLASVSGLLLLLLVALMPSQTTSERTAPPPAAPTATASAPTAQTRTFDPAKPSPATTRLTTAAPPPSQGSNLNVAPSPLMSPSP